MNGYKRRGAEMARQRIEFTSREIDAAASVLSWPHKRVLRMAQYDMTQSEMAESLGVPKGTIKSRLHRARAALAKQATQ